MTKDVSVIIVNYNTKSLTRNCLKSVFEQTDGIAFEVIVSDNGSTDGSLEMIRTEFPEVILIENGANLGFGAANNRALDVVKGKYVFYLNSDTVLLNNAVKIFYDYFEAHADEKLGAIGCNLLDVLKKPSPSSGNFNGYWRIVKWQIGLLVRHDILAFINLCHLQNIYKRIHERKSERCAYTPIYGEVDVIWGAALFLKNNTKALFDESFFLYAEETDLELRLHNEGLKRILIVGPQIVHYEGKNVRYDSHAVSTFSVVCQQISLVRYAKKNLGKKYAFLLRVIILLDWMNPFVPKAAVKKALTLNGMERL